MRKVDSEPRFSFLEHVFYGCVSEHPLFCLLPNWEIMDDNNTYFSGTVRDKQLTKTKEFILFVFLLFMVSRLECRTL